MATIDQAVTQLVLEAHRLPDWEVREALHLFWVGKHFWDEFDDEPRLHSKNYAVGGRTLGEHIEQTFCDFRCSPRPPAGELRRMTPNSDGVWKIHPQRTRVFGWCPGPRSFVAVTLALEEDLKAKNGQNLYDVKQREVLDFIARHRLESTVLRGDINAIFPPPR